MAVPSNLPNYNFASETDSQHEDEDDNAPIDPEKVDKQNWVDPMPPIWVLPLQDDYINEICSLLQQEEIHTIRAFMDEESDCLPRAEEYLNELTAKYSRYKVKLFLRKIKDMMFLYHEAKAFPTI
jgi:hypothetical protein